MCVEACTRTKRCSPCESNPVFSGYVLRMSLTTRVQATWFRNITYLHVIEYGLKSIIFHWDWLNIHNCLWVKEDESLKWQENQSFKKIYTRVILSKFGCKRKYLENFIFFSPLLTWINRTLLLKTNWTPLLLLTSRVVTLSLRNAVELSLTLSQGKPIHFLISPSISNFLF